MPQAARHAPRYVRHEGVAFREPTTRTSPRAWLMSTYMLLLAAWSVVASLHAHLWLGVLSAAVFVEFGLAGVRGRQLAGSPVFDEHLATRIARPLTELCAGAGCAVPRVSVLSRSTRAAFVRPGRDEAPLLVIAQPLVAALDDLELRAVLAHEVSHVAAGDLERARRRRWSFMVGGGVVCGLAALATEGDGIAAPVYVAGVLVGSMAVAVLLSLRQRPVEVRADAGAARLTGDPEHLVSGLEKTVAHTEAARRQVFDGPWRWLLAPLAWRVPSHPALADRAARIRHLAAAT
ncbi:MAG TPA: M48 family metallopeptidase [Acidimicrobiales bacterium]|nr:M48 family metallopeptidase [Acidimicrobiales bacterium]